MSCPKCGGDYYENLTFDKVDNLLEKMKSEGKRRVYTKDDMINI